MPTQLEALQERLESAKARLGVDAPIVKALQRQLAGYRSMAANREENFLVVNMPKVQSTLKPEPPTPPIDDAKQ